MSKPVLHTKNGKPIKHSSCLDKYKGEIVSLLDKGVQRKEVAIRYYLRKIGIKMASNGRTLTA